MGCSASKQSTSFGSFDDSVHVMLSKQTRRKIEALEGIDASIASQASITATEIEIKHVAQVYRRSLGNEIDVQDFVDMKERLYRYGSVRSV